MISRENAVIEPQEVTKPLLSRPSYINAILQMIFAYLMNGWATWPADSERFWSLRVSGMAG